VSVDLSASIKQSLQKVLEKARACQDQGKLAESAEAYRKCAQLMKDYAKYAVDNRTRSERLSMAKKYNSIAESLASGKPLRTGPSGPTDSTSEQQPNNELAPAIAALIHKAKIKWADIGGLDDTKKEIKIAYGIATRTTPSGIELSNLRGILFYGPPGTGKTLLAAATSSSLNATFFNVVVSSMLSKWFGESSKLITELYNQGREKAPSVVFLDECDALCASRDSEGHGASHQMLTTFLSEFDGLAGKGSKKFVLTVGATNKPWLLDDAVLSRFERKIYIPLPDAQARQAILEIHTLKKGHKIDFNLADLVQKTEGYSGRELEQVTREAVFRMLTQVNPELEDLNEESGKGQELKVRPLQKSDFDTALGKIKPQTSAESLKRYAEWARRVEE
jgi:SpoVK/Ycf46/Vps4 family AAA+-type ATPase